MTDDTVMSLKRVEVRHRFDVTPDVLFQAWTDAEFIAEWWAPEGFTTAVRTLDVRQSGHFHFDMTSPVGEKCAMTGTFVRVEPAKILVFELATHCNLGLPAGVPEQLDSATVVVQFLPTAKGTELVLTHAPLNAGYDDIATRSWTSTLKKLGQLLARSGFQD